MNTRKQRLKRLLFGMLGKDPDGVVVSFLTGDEPRALAMLDEIRQLVPERRHFAVTLGAKPSIPGVEVVALKGKWAWLLWIQLRRRFASLRVAQAPVLFTDEERQTPLRWAAWMLAPTRVLAFNARGERHHLRMRTAIASGLFLRGVPLDRIFLRPWKKSNTVCPDTRTVLEGRPLAEYRPRIAVLTPYLPWPLAHGGAVRIFNLLREAAREFDIFLFAFTEEDGTPECGPVLEFCAKVVLVGKPHYREPRWSTLHPPEVGEYRSATMRRALADLRSEHDFRLLQVEYTQLAEYGGDVLVEHDVTFDLYRQIHERAPGLSSWWNLRRWLRFERRAVGRFERVVVMSDKDAGLLEAPHAAVIGNGVDLARFCPQPEPPGQKLLFIGSFRHFPNVMAYRFFIEQVWPILSKRFPEMSLTAVAGPDPLLHWRNFTSSDAPPDHPRVRFLSYVADVGPLYEAANVVIVPTLVSAGTNVKVLEAMAMERAVVSTSSGCAGLGLEHGSSVWIADTPEDFAAGIAKLLSVAALRSRLAGNARRQAETQFDWRVLGEAQRTLWHDLLGDSIGIRAAREGDIEAIGSIQNASAGAARWKPADYLEHDCRVALTAGRVAGFLCLRRVADDEFEILNLAVEPAFRRRGIATALLRPLLAEISGAIFLEVRQSNVAAQTLYTELGSRRLEYESTITRNRPSRLLKCGFNRDNVTVERTDLPGPLISEDESNSNHPPSSEQPKPKKLGEAIDFSGRPIF